MKVKDLRGIIHEPSTYIYITNDFRNLREWDEKTLEKFGEREVICIYSDYRIECQEYIESFVVVEIDNKA